MPLDNNIDIQALKIKEQEEQFKKQEITDEIIKEHMNLIKKIAGALTNKNKMPPTLTYDDLVSYGMEGLMKAYQVFDNSKGASFVTYASYRVKGEILDHIRKEWKHRNPTGYKDFYAKARQNVAFYADDLKEIDIIEDNDPTQTVVEMSTVVYILSLENISTNKQETAFESESAECLIDEAEFIQEKAIIWDEVNNLEEIEKNFVYLFYEKGKKQNEIAEELLISNSKASRMHVEIIEKLRRRIKRRYE